VGELERIHASFGASFGNDLGPRIASAKDRQAKKHHHDGEEPSKEDALELHDEAIPEPPVVVILQDPNGHDHLDLSA